MKETPRHILESASHVFAERGFHDGNIADICERAGANIASVNYHFRSKKDLYVKVLKHCFEVAEQKRPSLVPAETLPSPEDRLRHFMTVQFHRIFCSGICGCTSRLTAHEMTNPTFAYNKVFSKLIAPQMAYLEALIGELIGEPVPKKEAKRCAVSVISLFAFYQFDTMAQQELLGRKRRTPKRLQEVVDHATEFALAGIAAVQQRLHLAESARRT